MTWRNPDDYAYTRELSRELWAWEFLRRDPEYRKPNVPDELLWREVFTEVPRVTRKDKEYLSGSNGRIALGFDLTSPLPAQLEEAKHLLVGEQRRLAQSGALPPRTVKASREDWTLCLRLLDAEAAQAPTEVIVETLFPGEENEDRFVKLGKEAHRLRDGGYIRILLMPQG